jgi:xanthine dehydrogenase accessory factor
MYNPSDVFRFLAAAQRNKKRVVLVTICHVTGASTRNPGAHLVVDEDGNFAGSLSGGCIEAAVTAEALEVLESGSPRHVRYGQGSPYIDIKLPCGGGIDLFFTEVGDTDLGSKILKCFDARQSLCLRIQKETGAIELLPGLSRFDFANTDEHLMISHIPPLRLVIFGQGATVVRLYKLAVICDADLIVLSPDMDMASHIPEILLLTSPTIALPIEFDAWTAAIMLFHDHDWDHILLSRILIEPCYYFGAMGSYKTHDIRCAAMREMGVGTEQIAKIIAPIGLIPSMRDPETLAVSILAQIVAAYNAKFLS